jgi:hypothetical protein
MASYEERRHSFAQYLKDRQVEAGYIPREDILEISDEDILEAYRKNSEDGLDLYTDVQEYGVIMEYSTNESIFQALENIKNQNHLDNVEKALFKEFSKEVSPVRVSDMDTKSALAKLSKLGINLSQDDVAHLLSEACSFFPEWIMEGHKFYAEERERNIVSIGTEKVCVACFLNETLHRFKTFRAWALHTDSSVSSDYKLKTCGEIFYKKFSDYSIGFAVRKNKDFDLNTPVEKFVNIIHELIILIFDYLSDLSLISCWVAGKELARDKVNENEQKFIFLKETHEHFNKKYPDVIDFKDKINYIRDLKEYLGKLSVEQLEVLSEIGIPVDMTRVIKNKTFKIIDEFLEKHPLREIEESN